MFRLVVVIASLFISQNIACAGELSPKLVQTIALPGVSGRLDHMAIDLEKGRLFLAALGNGSLEVIDLKEGSRTRRIVHLKEPQGVCFIPGLNRLFVTTGGDGICRVYEGDSLSPIGSIPLKEDADNIRYDSGSNRLLVGFGKGSIGIIDPEGIHLSGSIPLAGHPESFQIGKSGKIYVNVPSAGHLAVADLKSRRILSKWDIPHFRSFYPMVLIESKNRLVIASRSPSALLILDTESGRLVSSLPCGADADDIFYDAKKRVIYVSCGEGFLEIFQEINADEYRKIGRLTTAPGARTSLWVPELQRIFVAAPSQKGKPAAILVFAVPH